MWGGRNAFGGEIFSRAFFIKAGGTESLRYSISWFGEGVGAGMEKGIVKSGPDLFNEEILPLEVIGCQDATRLTPTHL